MTLTELTIKLREQLDTNPDTQTAVFFGYPASNVSWSEVGGDIAALTGSTAITEVITEIKAALGEEYLDRVCLSYGTSLIDGDEVDTGLVVLLEHLTSPVDKTFIGKRIPFEQTEDSTPIASTVAKLLGIQLVNTEGDNVLLHDYTLGKAYSTSKMNQLYVLRTRTELYKRLTGLFTPYLGTNIQELPSFSTPVHNVLSSIKSIEKFSYKISIRRSGSIDLEVEVTLYGAMSFTLSIRVSL